MYLGDTANFPYGPTPIGRGAPTGVCGHAISGRPGGQADHRRVQFRCRGGAAAAAGLVLDAHGGGGDARSARGRAGHA